MRCVTSLLTAAAALTCLVILGGCGESATSVSSNGMTLQGTVVYDSGDQAAQVTVHLFTANQDDQISQTLSSYPTVGFSPLSLMTYDPVAQEPLHTTQTDEDGLFQFEDLAAGTYVVDAVSPGYACAQPVLVTLEANSNAGTLQLSSVQETSGNLDAATWESGDVYLITGDLTVPPDVVLTIEPGVLVLLQGDFELKVYGGLQVLGSPSNPVRFRMESEESSSSGNWGGIRIEYATAECTIEGAVIQGASTAIRVKGADAQIGECLIDVPLTYGILFEGAATGSVIHSILRDGNYGIEASSSDPLISNNLILRMSGAGIEVKNNSQAEITNNAILDCQNGLWSDSDTSPLIEHNLFSGGNRAIYAQSGFLATVQFNEFSQPSGEGIHFEVGGCYPDLQNNNFRDMPQTILYANGNAGQQSEIIYAPNNYWDGEDSEGIPLRIIDGHDIGSPNNPIGIVEYEPFRLEPVSGAGP